MKKYLSILLLITLSINAQDKTHWVEIGEGTYEHGYTFPYKVKLFVPFGVRHIDDIKKGLFPLKISLNWLATKYTESEVQLLFLNQLKDSYTNKHSFKLSLNLIKYFIKKLPAIQRHDEWIFIYYPDEGTRIYIDSKKIYHLVGAELNRALLQSWLNKSPVLTSELFNRLLKLQ